MGIGLHIAREIAIQAALVALLFVALFTPIGVKVLALIDRIPKRKWGAW